MNHKILSLLVAGIGAALISTAPLAADEKAAPASGTRGTVKGGSDYERTMQQAGMSGMSGMSGDRSMTAKKSEAKAKKASKKKKRAAAAK